MECHARVPQEDKIKEASSWQQEKNQTDAKKGGVFLIHDDSLESLTLAALHLVFQGHAEQTFGNGDINFPRPQICASENYGHSIKNIHHMLRT